LESFEELGVFSASTSNESVGLEFWVDVDFTFFLKPDEIGFVHQELASKYRSVILSRAQEAIKNVAAKNVTFVEFFQERTKVESLFRDAVQARWDFKPSLHCTLDQFHLGRIRIPTSVATKQLEARVQNERNDQEQFLQNAQIEREMTAVEVNQINLETNKELRTAEAQASLIRTKALAEAELLKAQASINGTKMLLEAAGIESQDHMIVFNYINTLRSRNQLDIAVSYLSEDGVLRTAPVQG
jgi:regulator of protease activity HflC (stomatin/prohibitin superfamily)